MFHRVKDVQPLPTMILQIIFVDGCTKYYDVKPLMDKWDVFQDLTQNNLFDLVQVDAGGYGVIWNDYIDLACNELWYNGVETQNQPMSICVP
jgi:hypothetical protein